MELDDSGYEALGGGEVRHVLAEACADAHLVLLVETAAQLDPKVRAWHQLLCTRHCLSVYRLMQMCCVSKRRRWRQLHPVST